MKLAQVVEKFETKKDFLNAVDNELKKLSEANKDFRYIECQKDGLCQYNAGPTEKPETSSGCIFGQALFALGWDDQGERSIIIDIKELFRWLVSPEFVYDNNGKMSTWEKIQDKQDSGEPWGSIVYYIK